MQQTEEVLDTKEVKVKGEVLTELPEDLYIPPDALKIFLEAFEGPLDLLLYLIRKHNIDILDIPIAEITHQYIRYVELMHELQLELAAEYLLMAATLAQIKSSMLLPRPKLDELGEEGDPRAELIRRLQEYERFKKAAVEIEELPRLERDNFLAQAIAPKMDLEESHPDVSMQDLMRALKDVMQRAKLYTKHHIEREPLSVRERMAQVLSTVNADVFTPFIDFFTTEEGRMGVVVSLIAVLELIRQSVIELVQAGPYAPIYIKAKG